jgi:hypothetical protein
LGADLTLRDRMGGTALDDAIRERNFRAMQMLYDAGARPEGMKVAVQLCQAASEGDAQLVGLLTSKGASPNNGASPCPLRRWGVQGRCDFAATTHKAISARDDFSLN